MSYRLENLLKTLLYKEEYEVVDLILENLDVESTGNHFTDLVDIVQLCKIKQSNLESLDWFKKRLTDKIYYERGEEGKVLIEKVLK